MKIPMKMMNLRIKMIAVPHTKIPIHDKAVMLDFKELSFLVNFIKIKYFVLYNQQQRNHPNKEILIKSIVNKSHHPQILHSQHKDEILGNIRKKNI